MSDLRKPLRYMLYVVKNPLYVGGVTQPGLCRLKSGSNQSQSEENEYQTAFVKSTPLSNSTSDPVPHPEAPNIRVEETNCISLQGGSSHGMPVEQVPERHHQQIVEDFGGQQIFVGDSKAAFDRNRLKVASILEAITNVLTPIVR
ncbi:hypothetical protein AMTRI_Chr10g00 [Amborella trichopoda]